MPAASKGHSSMRPLRCEILCTSTSSPALRPTSILAPEAFWTRCTVAPPWPSTSPTKLYRPSCRRGACKQARGVRAGAGTQGAAHPQSPSLPARPAVSAAAASTEGSVVFHRRRAGRPACPPCRAPLDTARRGRAAAGRRSQTSAAWSCRARTAGPAGGMGTGGQVGSSGGDRGTTPLRRRALRLPAARPPRRLPACTGRPAAPAPAPHQLLQLVLHGAGCATALGATSFAWHRLPQPAARGLWIVHRSETMGHAPAPPGPWGGALGTLASCSVDRVPGAHPAASPDQGRAGGDAIASRGAQEPARDLAARERLLSTGRGCQEGWGRGGWMDGRRIMAVGLGSCTVVCERAGERVDAD